MKLNRKVTRLAASVLATAMFACATALPAMAVDAPAAAADKITFDSVLTLTDAEKYASVPEFSLTYTVSEGSEVAATDTNPVIYAGVLGGQSVTNTINYSNADSWDSGTVTKTVELDFSSITFPRAGIYRYIVTQTDEGTIPTDVTVDTNTTRYLDLYVENDTNNGGTDNLKIAHYVLLKTATTPTVDYDDTTGAVKTITYGDGSEKDEGYDHTYETNELELDKQVAGALGDMTSGAFDFTVTIAGLKENDTIGVKGATDVAFVTQTADNSGTVSLTGVKLGHGEKYTIVGLPTGATFAITENISANEGYKTEYNINSVGNVNEKSFTATAVEKQDDPNTVIFTNTRDSVTPTGVIMNVAPYVLMVVIAAAGCFVFLRKRRDD